MDLDLSHRHSQRVLKQRNLFAIVSAVLFLLLCGSFLVMANRSRDVVLVPTMHSTMTLNSAGVAPEYLEAVTRDTATVALNRSPENLDYWMKSLLDIADDHARGQLKIDLMKIYQEQSGSQISQWFTPDSMKVYPDKLESEVGGTVHTEVANKEITSQHRLFRMFWTYNGVSLKLRAFGAVVKAEPTQP
jgi:conjugal transfer pilus assembly protein TraE